MEQSTHDTVKTAEEFKELVDKLSVRDQKLILKMIETMLSEQENEKAPT